MKRGGHCPLATDDRMKRGGHCPLATDDRMKRGGRCPFATEDRMKRGSHCPFATEDRMKRGGHCPLATDDRMKRGGHCPSSAAGRLLPPAQLQAPPEGGPDAIGDHRAEAALLQGVESLRRDASRGGDQAAQLGDGVAGLAVRLAGRLSGKKEGAVKTLEHQLFGFLAFHPQVDSGVDLLVGVDHLYGNADLHSGDFDYFASLDGRNVPSLSELPPAGALKLTDKRNFSGLYVQTEWNPSPRWRFQVGGRLNHTTETQDTVQGDAGAPPSLLTSADRTVTRGSGSAGVSWLAYQSGAGTGADAAWLYADYRNTFKPSALDFGAGRRRQHPEARDRGEL
jgi:hypothetical protein